MKRKTKNEFREFADMESGFKKTDESLSHVSGVVIGALSGNDAARKTILHSGRPQTDSEFVVIVAQTERQTQHRRGKSGPSNVRGIVLSGSADQASREAGLLPRSGRIFGGFGIDGTRRRCAECEKKPSKF